MNYQCNSCGAPNISSTNCQYCSSKIEGKNQSISKTDKGMFDLAIYELKEGEEGDEEALEKSLKLFNKIITKDPDNYSAWLYKMICEFRLDSETKKFIKKVTANHKIQSIPIFEDLFLALLKDGLLPEEVKSTNYLSFSGNINLNKADIDALVKLSLNQSKFFQVSLVKIFSKRYTHTTWKEDGVKEIEWMLLEIKAFLSLYYFSEIDKEIASELLENIKKFNLLCLKNGKEISDAELTEEDFFLYIQDIINELKNVYTTLNWETKSIDIYEEECKVIMSKKENNDDDSVKKCFIATAAMGNYNHPIVIELRQFRDEWLLKRAWGVRFTKRYYEHGPKAANVIEKSTFLKKVVFILIVKPLQIVTKPLIRRANN